jgi:hypothetical protein
MPGKRELGFCLQYQCSFILDDEESTVGDEFCSADCRDEYDEQVPERMRSEFTKHVKADFTRHVCRNTMILDETIRPECMNMPYLHRKPHCPVNR